MNNQFKILTIASQISLLSFTMACGGGGGDSDPDPVVQEPEITWTQNVFVDESQFKNKCENPRSGTDILGRPFPDTQGSTLAENHWLRSWSNNTYLWYAEIVDQNPASFNNPISYFDTLKTNARTANGSPKDNFHFNLDSAEYLEQTQAGVSSGYGIQWAFVRNSIPRELRVAFSEPNGPAAQANLTRGAEILEIDGVDLVNANTQAEIDVLNAGLSPNSAGETHTFLVRDLNSSTTREITLTSADVVESAVLATDVINTTNGKVGYVVYNTFSAFSETELVNAFETLEAENVDDLVLDLRYNGGGRISLASELSYMIAGNQIPEEDYFYQVRFNDKHPEFDPVTGQELTPTPFYNTTGGGNAQPGLELPTLNLSRVFVLTTGGTCSASEAVINGLRGINIDVVLIGNTTCGKPYGFYPTDNCGTTYFTIQLTGENASGFGEYPDGFTPENSISQTGVSVPGCSVQEDYQHDFGDPDEILLAQALSYRETGTCSTTNAQKASANNQKPIVQGLSIKLPSNPAKSIMIMD